MKREPLHLARALWLAPLAATVHLAVFTAGVLDRPTHGFVAYYAAARLVTEGAETHQFYDDDWFRRQVARFESGASDIYNLNPPTTALLAIPVAALEHRAARRLWTVLSALCLAVALRCLVHETGMPQLQALPFAAFALLVQPVHANLRYGQAYLVMLALLTTAWYGYRHARPAVCGSALGALLVLKMAGSLLWPLLLLRRRWRELGWSAATVCVIVLASLPWLHRHAWEVWLELLPSLSLKPELAVTAYQTQSGLLRHLLVPDLRWNPAPWLPAPALEPALRRLGAAVILGLSVTAALWPGPGPRASMPRQPRRAARPAARPEPERRRADLLFAAFTAAGIILSPVSLDYHYALLLIPMAILAADLRSSDSWPPRALLAAAMALIGLDLGYGSLGTAGGPIALLGYPKLYGAWLLWGLALCRSLPKRDGRPGGGTTAAAPRS
ncbi:MAG: DUF2029 domain-containing protein [Candidatus Schekmanbacteria bacterium]|nr:DUF2029 domain-containing protein [Candidatus Schekmanbacteria bacterium]